VHIIRTFSVTVGLDIMALKKMIVS